MFGIKRLTWDVETLRQEYEDLRQLLYQILAQISLVKGEISSLKIDIQRNHTAVVNAFTLLRAPTQIIGAYDRPKVP